jgi:23S rRNA pseudouridine2605 synthase
MPRTVKKRWPGRKPPAVPRGKLGKVNLARALSKLGLCSRSEAIKLILAGSVTVGGKVILDPSHRCVPERDAITLSGSPARKQEPIYIVMNKPTGVVTTRSDELGRSTVYDSLGENAQWVFPVGRLDKESAGVLLFTNDTRFGERLTNPESHIEKCYEVVLDKPFRQEHRRLMESGMVLDGEQLLPVQVDVRGDRRLELILVEGRNRQIRRMCETLGYSVESLCRISFGNITLEGLAPGTWRYLRADEIAALQNG